MPLLVEWLLDLLTAPENAPVSPGNAHAANLLAANRTYFERAVAAEPFSIAPPLCCFEHHWRAICTAATEAGLPDSQLLQLMGPSTCLELDPQFVFGALPAQHDIEAQMALLPSCEEVEECHMVCDLHGCSIPSGWTIQVQIIPPSDSPYAAGPPLVAHIMPSVLYPSLAPTVRVLGRFYCTAFTRASEDTLLQPDETGFLNDDF